MNRLNKDATMAPNLRQQLDEVNRCNEGQGCGNHCSREKVTNCELLNNLCVNLRDTDILAPIW